MAIYCHQKDVGFTGENITSFANKVCNGFFPTPTDVGK